MKKFLNVIVLCVVSVTPLAQAPQTPGGNAAGRGVGRAARTPNLVPGPELPYVAIQGALQWPRGTDHDETETPGVATNSTGHVFVFHRPEPGRAPLFEFDQDGKFVKSWGHAFGILRAHGLRIDDNDNIWITDVNIHQVIKMDPQGNVVMTLGTKGQPGKWQPAAGTELLNQPTDVGFDSVGNIYVANSHGGPDPRLDKFDKNGKFIKTWRMEPREGNSANFHTVAVAGNGTVYAASREQRMIRVYDPQGALLRTMDTSTLVCGLYLDKEGDLWMTSGTDGQVIKLDKMTAQPIGVIGKGPGTGADQFGEAHYMTIAPKGEIYVSDATNKRVAKFIRR